MDVLVVVPTGPEEVVPLDRSTVDRFKDIKGRVLGYAEVDFRVPTGPTSLSLQWAPLGAVRTQEDANRLIETLSTDLPGVNFGIQTFQYSNDRDIVWYQEPRKE
jgi:hypothetical protein